MIIIMTMYRACRIYSIPQTTLFKIIAAIIRFKETAAKNRYLVPVYQRLQICKRDIKQEPLFENTADADAKDCYDVSVLIAITAESLVDGNA